MNDRDKISIIKIRDDNVSDAVFESLKLIDAKAIIKEGLTILLKPNLLSAKPPERAVTTHPEVLRAVIRWVKQFNPKKLYVCDSSGGIAANTTEKALKASGLLKVCDEEGAECMPFEKTEVKIYSVKDPLVLDDFPSSILLDSVDLIINLPKIKTHSQCLLTCCIKNMFGTMLLANKPKTHARFPTLDEFSAALADIYSVSNPQLTIVDGYLCQEGNGPSSGDVVKLDLILAGFNGVALDRVICEIIGFRPEDIVHLQKASEKGLGSLALTDYEILGEKIEDVKRRFKEPVMKLTFPVKLPRFITSYISNNLFKAKISFNPEKCKLCGTCWKNCPVSAITPPDVMKDGNVPSWDKNKCITCYCCAELCPYEAVEIKIKPVQNLLLSWFGVGCFGLIITI
ncbi:MAG: DUF362 domain-containing protein, partial [Promethearchaeota archaeon]